MNEKDYLRKERKRRRRLELIDEITEQLGLVDISTLEILHKTIKKIKGGKRE